MNRQKRVVLSVFCVAFIVFSLLLPAPHKAEAAFKDLFAPVKEAYADTASVFSSIAQFFSNLFGEEPVPQEAPAPTLIDRSETSTNGASSAQTQSSIAPQPRSIPPSPARASNPSVLGVTEQQLNAQLQMLEARWSQLLSESKSVYVVQSSGGSSASNISVPASTAPIQRDGNFGIGTSSPYAPLSVNGEIAGAYFTGSSQATSTFAGGISTNLLRVTSTIASSTFANGINLESGCFAVSGTCLSSGVSSQWTTSGNNIYYTTGNVGIGTTSPYAKLSVVGEVVAGYFTATTTATSTFGGPIQVRSNIAFTDFSSASSTIGFATTSGAISIGRSISIQAASTSQGSGQGGNVGLVGGTAGGGTSGGTGGNVFLTSGQGGWGSTISGPAGAIYLLGGVGGGHSSSFGGTGGGVNIVGGTGGIGSTGGSGGSIALTAGSGGGTGAGAGSAGGITLTGGASNSVTGGTLTVSGAVGGGSSPGGITLNPGAGSSAVANILLGSQRGKVGVGATTTPGAMLSVFASTSVPSILVGSTTGTNFVVAAYGNVGVGTGTPKKKFHVFTNLDEAPVRFEDTNGYCEIDPTSTSWTCTSDSRLKKDIVALSASDSLTMISKLRPVSFKWQKQEGSEKRFGLIAQEVETVFPEFVTTDEQGFKSVSYGSFTPFMISALQELDLKVEAFQKVPEGTNMFAAGITWATEKLAAATGYFKNIFAGKITTQELCVGDTTDQVCITKDQLRTLLQSNGTATIIQPIVQTPPETQPATTSPETVPVQDTEEQNTETPVEPPTATEPVGEEIPQTEPQENADVSTPDAPLVVETPQAPQQE